jgi:hypothetical protein
VKHIIPKTKRAAWRIFVLDEALFVVKSPYAVFGSLFQWKVTGGTAQLINSKKTPPVRRSRKA